MEVKEEKNIRCGKPRYCEWRRVHTFSLTAHVGGKNNRSAEYKTRTEWHRAINLNKLGNALARRYRKALTSSKTNCATANIPLRNPLPAFASLRKI